MSNHKRIGILTSGGDCPGLNAVIRAVVKAACLKGWEVYGIPHGTDGFIKLAKGEYQPDDFKLPGGGYNLPGTLKGVDILQFLSGSLLGSLSQGHPEQPGVAAAIQQGYQLLHLDALVAVGGDGSLDIIYDLAHAPQQPQHRWNLIAIPKTIDNDVPFTERSVGFDTAVEIVTQALYDLTFTAAAHDRVMVVQVMGRDAGHLALHAGIAGGADIILIPELTPHLTEEIVDQCCRQIEQIRNRGRKFALVVIAEGVKNEPLQKEKYIGDYLSNSIRKHGLALCEAGEKAFCAPNQVETREVILGDLQRSRTPCSADRLLATLFGVKAVELIEQERYDQLIIWEQGQVDSKPLEPVIAALKKCHQQKVCTYPVEPNGFMVQTARTLGIYLGET